MCIRDSRKTLRNALKPLLAATDLEQTGIDPGLRPEQVDVAGFVTLANLAAARQAACKPAREP